MKQSAHLEIHFYTEHEAAIVFETFAQDDERKSTEIQAFNSFTLRQLDNLQSGGIPLARLFASMKDSIDFYMNYIWILRELKTPEEMSLYFPFVGALGVDLSEAVKIPALQMPRLSLGGDTKELAKTLWPNIAHVVTYRGSAAGKRFTADIELKDQKVFLKLDQKGFGLFGKGINYYAPMSTVLLLKYLTDKHKDDWEYEARLRKSAQLCGQAFVDGKVNSLSLIVLPTQIERQTLK